MNCIRFLIFGQVQKVFYRKYVSQALGKIGFVGYIKNLSNGSVEVTIKSEPNQNISNILEILNQGSPKSKVESINMDSCNENIKFNKKFEVRY